MAEVTLRPDSRCAVSPCLHVRCCTRPGAYSVTMDWTFGSPWASAINDSGVIAVCLTALVNGSDEDEPDMPGAEPVPVLAPTGVDAIDQGTSGGAGCAAVSMLSVCGLETSKRPL